MFFILDNLSEVIENLFPSLQLKVTLVQPQMLPLKCLWSWVLKAQSCGPYVSCFRCPRTLLFAFVTYLLRWLPAGTESPSRVKGWAQGTKQRSTSLLIGGLVEPGTVHQSWGHKCTSSLWRSLGKKKEGIRRCEILRASAMTGNFSQVF